MIKTLPRNRENKLLKKYDYIIGVDEAGRGPIAGPVVCAALYFEKGTTTIKNIIDSKKITSEQAREKLYQEITESSGVHWHVSIISPSQIDELNILNATLLGMKNCINHLVDKSKSFYSLIDGNKKPKNIDCPCETIVKGDGKEYIIAAASILAKVTRDRLMNKLELIYTDFSFSQHKGYPTKKHKEEIEKNGILEIHRKTFRPIKDYLKKI